MRGNRGKRLFWEMAGLVLWGLVLIFLCSGGKREETVQWRIAAVMPDGSNSFWREAQEGVSHAAKDCSVKLTVYPYDINAAEAVMNESLEKAILSKVDGILLSANQCSGQETKRLLSMAREQGIRLVLCDTDSDSLLRDAFLGADDREGGEQAAREVLENGDLHRVLVMVKPGEYISDASGQRLEAFCQAIENAEQSVALRLVELPEEGDGYYEKIQSALLACEGDTAVVCLNTGFSFLVAQTISRLNLEEELVLIGFGTREEAEPYLENGSLDILFSQCSYELGYKGIEVMCGLLSGEETEKTEYYMDFQVIRNEVQGFDY